MDGDAVADLITRMQCTESEAQAALLAAQGNHEQALALLRRSIFGLKAKFRSELRKVCGLFFVFVDGEKESVLRLHAVLTHEQWLYNTDLNQPVMEFEDFIYNTEFRIKTIPGLTKDVNDRCKEKLKFDTLKRLVAAMVNGELPAIIEVLRLILSAELADRELDLLVNVEKLSRVKFDKLEKQLQQAPAPDAGAPAEGGAAAGEKPAEATEKILVLKTDIILSPISGRPVRDLHIGDKIYVKITDNSPQGRYIANLLKGDAPVAQPVLVPIKELTRTESDRCSVITQFGPGVFGRVVVNTEAKIKCEGTEVRDEPAAAEAGGEDTLLPMLLGGAVLVLVLLVIAWYVFFGT